MGIDIYMRWQGQTEVERNRQFTGFSIESGHAGYLREAYHGGPYVTKFLVAEAFSSPDGAEIPAEILRDRLPAALTIARVRSSHIYNQDLDDDSPVLMAFINFVALAESVEKMTGKPVTIIASY